MPWPKYRSGAIRAIGETQAEILRRGQVITGPDDNARWCAVKRLVQRGLMERQVFGSVAIGFTVIYSITPAGREALRRHDRSA